MVLGVAVSGNGANVVKHQDLGVPIFTKRSGNCPGMFAPSLQSCCSTVALLGTCSQCLEWSLLANRYLLKCWVCKAIDFQHSIQNNLLKETCT